MRMLKNCFWLAVCIWMFRTDENLTFLILKPEEISMKTLASSSPHFKWPNALIAVPLFITGVAGVFVGGTVWGLLGVAGVLISVWVAIQSMQSDQLSREIERLYPPRRELFPAAATERVKSSVPRGVGTPLRDLEAVRR